MVHYQLLPFKCAQILLIVITRICLRGVSSVVQNTPNLSLCNKNEKSRSFKSKHTFIRKKEDATPIYQFSVNCYILLSSFSVNNVIKTLTNCKFCNSFGEKKFTMPA